MQNLDNDLYLMYYDKGESTGLRSVHNLKSGILDENLKIRNINTYEISSKNHAIDIGKLYPISNNDFIGDGVRARGMRYEIGSAIIKF